MKKKTMKTWLAMVVVVGFSIVANAQLTTSTVYWTSTPVSSNSVTDWSHTIAFAKFNTASGTLSEVVFHTTSSMDSRFYITNNGPTNNSATIRADMSLSIYDPDRLDIFTNDAPQITALFPASGWRVNPAPGQSLTSSVYRTTQVFDRSYTDAGVLNEFTGNPVGGYGDILLDASTYTLVNASWSGGGDVQIGQASHAGLNGYVQYIYTIPEPSTVVLAGLAGLAFFQRHRMRKLKRPV